jgi:cell wall-associated NlpC family hydrolase
MSMFRSLFLKEAMKYEGVPYAYAGQGPDKLDCSGFAVEVLRDMGFNIPDMNAEALAQTMFTQPLGCRGGSIQAVFLIEDISEPSQHISHIGLMLEDDVIIHANEKYGAVTITSLHKFESDYGLNYFMTWMDMCELMCYWRDEFPNSIGKHRDVHFGRTMITLGK